MFSLCKKKKKNWREYSNLCLLKKTKSFDFKKKKNQICFYMCKRYEKDFLRGGFHS